jgi:hypothetical protein
LIENKLLFKKKETIMNLERTIKNNPNIDISVYTSKFSALSFVSEMHTDNIEFIPDIFDLKKHDVLDYALMDAEDLNTSVYANSTYTAEEDEIIILVK